MNRAQTRKAIWKRLELLLFADWILIALLSAISFWYTTSISAGALWGDEVQYAVAGTSVLAGNPFVNIVHMFAPFGKYLIGLSQFIFGATSFGARVGIVLTSLLTLCVIYFVARQLQGPKTGILAVIALSSIPLFATHATSAMLDLPLAAGVTVICGLTLLETQAPGTKWRDIIVGISIIIASASKAYGFIYVLGPLLSYIILRKDSGNLKDSLIRVGGSLAISFIIVYFPLMLASPPDYYSGVDLPASIAFIFDLPIIGGIAYAFGSSFYFNIFAGHEGSTAPSIVTTIMWIVDGGPFVLFGMVVSVGTYLLPERWRIEPWWVPAVMILPPLFIFTLILPKGFARFALPIFPIAVLVVSLVSSRIIQDLSLGRVPQLAIAVVILITAISPASAFLFADQNLSADSKYDEVAEFLSSKEGDTSVVASGRHELMWYLGDRHTEKYYRYLNASAVRNYETANGRVKLSGISKNIDLLNRVKASDIDYVVLSEESDYYEVVQNSPRMELVETFSAYTTNEKGTHQVSIWRVENQNNKTSNKRAWGVDFGYV
ncbi:ArnT family glycosyltransferase [Halobacterium yunchengense]|uniref:ArnT family glycosyltransferase n=1 Tax=Halobacterium yunchengense TaxID=3108497 RepID=UPI00300BAC5E